MTFWGPLRLLANHPQALFQRLDAIPPQFERVEPPAPNRVDVRVIQAGNDASSAGIDHARPSATKFHHFVVRTDSDEFLSPNGEGRGFRDPVAQCDDPSVVDDDICDAWLLFSGRVNRPDQAGRNRDEHRHAHAGEAADELLIHGVPLV